MKREPVWIRFVRPPFAMVGFALNAIYVVLFGWWLDARTFRQLDAALAKAIHENLGFLFTEKNARIIPSDDYRVKRAFDFSVVTIATDDLHIRFITVRGEFDVEVSSPQLPYHWEELSSAIESAKLSEGAGLNEMAGTGRSRSYSFYVDVEKLLRSHWDLLTRYCRRSWRYIPISDNVGGVKHDLSTRPYALGEERHFALVDGLRFPTWGSLLIVRVRNSVRPSHLFDHLLRS